MCTSYNSSDFHIVLFWWEIGFLIVLYSVLPLKLLMKGMYRKKVNAKFRLLRLPDLPKIRKKTEGNH